MVTRQKCLLNSYTVCIFLIIHYCQQEKKVSEDKLNDLEFKIKEYSEMVEENTNNKLPSINENAELEEQVLFFSPKR